MPCAQYVGKKAPPVITFLGKFASGSQSLSIGPADTSRWLVGFNVMENDSGANYGSGTVGGVSPTWAVNPGVIADWYGMWYINVPAGTSVSTVFTAQAMMVWMITGLSSGRITDTGGSVASNVFSVSGLSVLSNNRGAAIWAARSRGSMTTYTAGATAGLIGVSNAGTFNNGGGGNPSEGGGSGLLDGTGSALSFNLTASAAYSAGGGAAIVLV